MHYYLGAAMEILKMMGHLVASRPRGPGYSEMTLLEQQQL